MKYRESCVYVSKIPTSLDTTMIYVPHPFTHTHTSTHYTLITAVRRPHCAFCCLCCWPPNPSKLLRSTGLEHMPGIWISPTTLVEIEEKHWKKTWKNTTVKIGKSTLLWNWRCSSPTNLSEKQNIIERTCLGTCPPTSPRFASSTSSSRASIIATLHRSKVRTNKNHFALWFLLNSSQFLYLIGFTKSNKCSESADSTGLGDLFRHIHFQIKGLRIFAQTTAPQALQQLLTITLVGLVFDKGHGAGDGHFCP